MPIRLRLVLSYIAMFIVPTLVIFVVAIVLLIGSMGHAGTKLEEGKLAELISQAPTMIYQFFKAKDETPQKLLDPAYLKEMETRIKIIGTGIFVMQDETMVYRSNNLTQDDVEKALVSYRKDQKNSKLAATSDKHPLQHYKPYSILQDSFKVSGIDYQVYLVDDTRPGAKFIKDYFSTLSILILLILLIVTGILTFIVSRSILKPLEELKMGVKQISQGNLNFSIKYRSSDELGMVCRAFEEMRIKLKDLTEQKLLDEESRKELISNISHDLKTPITSIKGYVEGILDHVADSPQKVEKYLATIHKKAEHMDKLIDDLFYIQDWMSKKVPFVFEAVGLKQYMQELFEELAIDMEKKGMLHSLSIEAPENTLVTMDRGKIKRVIVNIIENAQKYCDKDEKKLDIKVTDQPDYLEITFTDNGQGFLPGEEKKIFERFYRTDEARSSESGGTGLGLPIAKQIIESHGGIIWASCIPGEATTIGFTLKKTEEPHEKDLDH